MKYLILLEPQNTMKRFIRLLALLAGIPAAMLTAQDTTAECQSSGYTVCFGEGAWAKLTA